MAMNENDIRFGARGFSPRAMLRGQGQLPEPGIDPTLIEAIAQALSQRGGLQQYGQGLAQGPVAPDAFQNALYEQDQRARFGMPDPAQVFAQGPELAAPQEPLAPFAADDIRGLETAEPPMQSAPEEKDAAPAPKKKKGEYSDFFKLLAAAKKEDKKGSTRKAFKDLAKQLDSGNAEGTIATS